MGKSTISMVIFHSYFDITRGFIVDFPIEMVIFHSFLYVYQRVSHWGCHTSAVESAKVPERSPGAWQGSLRPASLRMHRRHRRREERRGNEGPAAWSSTEMENLCITLLGILPTKKTSHHTSIDFQGLSGIIYILDGLVKNKPYYIIKLYPFNHFAMVFKGIHR